MTPARRVGSITASIRPINEVHSMMKSESIAALSAALVKTMGELQNVVADAPNPFFKSKYAKLPDILDVVRPVLAANGLAVVQVPSSIVSNGVAYVGVESTIIHKSGEWMHERFVVPLQKQDPQGAGSAVTYCRRYALCAILQIGQEDDDGNGGTERATRSQSRAPAQPKSATAAASGGTQAAGPGSGGGVPESGQQEEPVGELASKADVSWARDAMKGLGVRSKAKAQELVFGIVGRNVENLEHLTVTEMKILRQAWEPKEAQ